MMQISLVAYAVSGAFLNLSTYDLYYALLAMIAIQRRFLEQKLAAGLKPAETPPDETIEAPATMPQPAMNPHIPGRSFLRKPA